MRKHDILMVVITVIFVAYVGWLVSRFDYDPLLSYLWGFVAGILISAMLVDLALRYLVVPYIKRERES